MDKVGSWALIFQNCWHLTAATQVGRRERILDIAKMALNIISGFALLIPSVCASVHTQDMFKPPAVDTAVSFLSGWRSDLQDQSIDQNSVESLVLSLHLNLLI